MDAALQVVDICSGNFSFGDWVEANTLHASFSHEVHAGRFWSHRFLRSLHLLQADTLRKDELALAFESEGTDVAGNEVMLEGLPW